MSHNLKIEISNYDKLITNIKNMENDSGKIIKRTVADIKKRTPGWVAQEVTKKFNIKKNEVNGSKKAKETGKSAGSIYATGSRLSNVEIIYRGRLLTPTHFSMRPSVKPKKRKYNVTASIMRGNRKVLSRKAFLLRSGGEGTIELPFKRTGKGRYPLEVIKSISLPQMIENPEVYKNIQIRMGEEIENRMQHHINQMLK
ncbi:phage tail protein [Lachnotalea glycerini]|uniref:Minor tail protein Z (GPZ) n=1 Tax=Lachnotalea glycerini TaxID=1763509 RepID=A0A371JBX1_9FIRM|nr:phage tail protein [Lachnotalea glycerini]RDY30178.1 hypothetical protein CG710_016205 [Lachnotalea glycerini]